MTIKIKAPRATIKWAAFCDPEIMDHESLYKLIRPGTKTKARIVRESDWRKLMKLVREVEATEIMPTPLWDALQALREKKK